MPVKISELNLIDAVADSDLFEVVDDSASASKRATRAQVTANCEKTANKGAANGYASLDSTGKVPASQLPPATVGGDVIGPSVAVIGHVATFADTTGKVIEDSGVSVVDVILEGDGRLTNARVPTAHKVSHQDGGPDEIDVTGLSGVLADTQHPIIGAGATQAVAGNDARLTDARTPTAHAASHAALGTDPVTIAESQVTNLTADLAAKVVTTRQVISGGGLTGGGDLSADRTLAVGAGTGVTVNADDVEVKYGTIAGTAAQGNDSRLSDARAPTAHNVLSASHGDTVTASVLRGDVIVGNSTPKWARLAAGAAKTVLRSDGTDVGYASKDTLCTEFTLTTTGNIDDLDFSNADLIRFNNATDATLRGLKVGTAGQIVVIVSIGAGHVFLAHQDAGSTATYRLINFATSGKTPLAAGSGVAAYQYDGTTGRWRLIAHEQGAWITVAYDATNFTASGSMTWGVDNQDQANYSYRLSGRTLTTGLAIQQTDVGGTADNTLKVKLPGGFTATKYSFSSCLINDAGGGFVAGFVQIESGGTTIDALKYGTGVWTLTSGDNTWLRATIECEVN